MPARERRIRVDITLAPDVVADLADVPNRSAYIEQLIRADMKRAKSRANQLVDIHTD